MSVSAVGVLLNIAVILAIVVDPLKALRKGPWITILSLATADMITCIFGFCKWGQTTFFANEPRKLYFNLVDFGWAFGFSASFLMLTFLTVQTFLVTNFPMKGRYWLTTTKIMIFGIGFWLFAIPLGLANIAYLCFSLRTSLNVYIAQIGILEAAAIAQVVLHIHVAVVIVKSGRHISANVEIRKHKKIAKTVIILSIILFFTAFPYFLFKQLEYLLRLEYFGQSETGQILYAISYCYTPIAVLNFVANPVLYSLRLPSYRNSLLALVGKRNSSFPGGEMQHITSKPTNEFLLRSRATCEIHETHKVIA